MINFGGHIGRHLGYLKIIVFFSLLTCQLCLRTLKGTQKHNCRLVLGGCMGGPPYILNYMEEGKRKKKLTDSARKRSHVSANKKYRARKALISGNIKLPVSIMNRSSDGKPKHCSSASQMRILQKLCLTCTIAGECYCN